jgi:hypothetical protein
MPSKPKTVAPQKEPSKIATGELQRVTVILRRDQLERLEQLRVDLARKEGRRLGQVISASEIVRALIDTFLESAPELPSGKEPEKALKERLDFTH